MVETSRDRLLKAIDHIRPDVTPVHILGFEGIERWLECFGASDSMHPYDKPGSSVVASSRSCSTSICCAWATGPEYIGLFNGAAWLVYTIASLPAGWIGVHRGNCRTMIVGLSLDVIGTGLMLLG